MHNKHDLLNSLKKAKGIVILNHYDNSFKEGVIKEVTLIKSFINVSFEKLVNLGPIDRPEFNNPIPEEKKEINIQINKNLMIFFHYPSEKPYLSLIRSNGSQKYLHLLFYREIKK